ncbi:neuronal PAS domain-containing protein 2-like isoform X4 [Cyanistes caeruleus]|uniref:neuronal PAS domain-containing protein 2-like isoform X4 n=1 Tax=Cyanistes caeruleus TaxID=156563 RepID=UPI000CDB8B07|nr:neuronal PAS domain-containing protein 2-like isoform X4 [Cyanistes caeruleus]
MDEDEKDRAKRASRNKSEKKRRDQFNVLIKELCTMLQGHGHPLKMDKSTILQRTIDFLQKQKEITAQTEACQIRQDWKPSFLSNEEFTQLMLEALDGFLIALTTDGIIIYVSDSVSSLLGHLPSDLVDQNILNFLPEGEQSEVYKLLSPHVLMTDPVAADFLNVPTPSCNGFESAIARAFRSATEEQICLVATVRLVTPQFLKELCNTEEPCEEFTSRHSLEWKFLFLDHRAPPIIGYLPFEVLGTSGYDYYHADDLELLARCHEHLMQFGKGKSCYYRFLTKGQQWIWLQTHYYITYHQWNSKPEFIVCTHLVVSYAEVRAERRRDLGLEESSIELASSSLKSHSSYLDVGQCGSSQDASREGVSLSSHSSQHSSHTTLSNSTSTSSLRRTDTSTPTRPSVPGASGEKTALRLATVRSTQAIAIPQAPGERLCQHPVAQLAGPSQNPLMPVYHFPTQLGMMHQLKEQLEERTRILQADIKTQQEELHVIKEQLQLVQDSNLQMLMQQPIPVILNTVQQLSPRRPPPQGTPRQTTAKKSQQPVLMGTKHYCSTHLLSPHPFLRDPCGTVPQVQQQKQQHPIRGSQGQQLCVPGQASISVPFYNNPMVFSQTHPITVAAQVPTDSSERQPPADYSQDRSLRMLLDQSIQAMMPTANSNCQPLQSSASRQQGKLVAEQQTLPPPAQVQPVTCSTIRPPAPPPIFSPSLMIPHSSFTSHQASTPVHLHQWPQQQVQQHHLYLQMQGPELVPGAPIQRIFQPSHTPQQNPLSYFLHPQQQSHHTQGQPCNLPDLPEMQLP